jgi:predicted nucleotide-binding protein
LAAKSQIVQNAELIATYMLKGGYFESKNIKRAALMAALPIAPADFQAADSYLLQKSFVAGSLGSDGVRWLTALGVDFAEAAHQANAESDNQESTSDQMPDPRSVFVVYGRNGKLRSDFFGFLRSVGLDPLEWSQALKLTGKASPYIGEVLDKAFQSAQAIVVLLTPDDEVHLGKELWSQNEPEDEKHPMRQARPNVLFEAGMAFGRNPDRTLLVEIGRVKPFSDVGGRHIVKLSNAPQKRQDIVNRLRTAGCSVSTEGADWLEVGNFDVEADNGIGGQIGLLEIQEDSIKFVDINYPEDSGIAKELNKQGFDTAWCMENNLARRLDIDGWSLVTQPTASGKQVILRMKDRPQDQTLIKRKKAQP